MSFKQIALYPCSPNTVRGSSTKLSATKDKVIYANNRTVIIRDLKNAALSTTFSGHTYNTTVARFSPSGFYCASADISGTVKIWDTIGEDQSVKWEYKVLSGTVNDLAWDGESQRIIAVGHGREKFGHAFLVNSGSSTGQISGHSKAINAVSIKQQRPYRAATASDDNAIVFHEGVPFKYHKTIRTHTQFVQDVQFGPSGDHFASVGSDSKIFLYDGKAGEMIAELDNPHKGTIMSCSWSPDSKSFFTASLDCTVRLWDVETRKSLQAWSVGTDLLDQQVGGVWSGADDLVSLSLSGNLNVFDPRTAIKPTRVFQAPQKKITAALSTSSSTFLTGSADGRVLSYDTDLTSSPSDAVQLMGGALHTNQVSGMAAANSGKVYTVGYDDHMREIEGSAYTHSSIPLLSQPKSVAVTSDLTVFVAGISSVEAIRDNQRVFELKPTYTPTAVGAGGNVVAVGGEDKRVRVHIWNGTTMTLTLTRELPKSEGEITALALSSDGALIVQGNSAGKIALYHSQTGERIQVSWDWHAARIDSLAFLPSLSSPPSHVVSGSLDTHVYVWSLKNMSKRIFLKNAGPGGVTCVLWLGERCSRDGKEMGRILSAGADGCARVWEVELAGKA